MDRWRKILNRSIEEQTLTLELNKIIELIKKLDQPIEDGRNERIKRLI